VTLAHPLLLHFLWLVPLAALALVIIYRRKRRDLLAFCDPELASRLAGERIQARGFLKSMLLLGGLALMILALAGPRWGSHYQEVSQKGVDIMLAVDVSSSMLVEDVQPTRLERARREVHDLLQVVAGDRVGLVAFAGAAFVQCPLTLDYGALTMFLEALRPDLIPVPGTDLGGAVDTALSAFDPASETDRVILLITDGEDNEGAGLRAAERAARAGVKIFIFGIGDPAGGPVPEGQGGFKKDAGGRMIMSRLDESGLKRIAEVTGGTYVRSTGGDLDLDLLYYSGIKMKTEASVLKSGKIKVYEERFAAFILVAFVLLLLEAMVGERKRPSVT
jgi:Ca-activated chloride channel family protein